MSNTDVKNISDQVITSKIQTTQVIQPPIIMSAPPPQEVKIVTNRPKPEEMITPMYISESVMDKISKDILLKKKFEKTMTELKSLQEQTKKEKCSSCEFNRRGKNLVNFFVEEMKSCTKEEQIVILTFLGKRTITSINENWLNVATNEIIPFEFRIIKMGQQIDPVVFKDLKGQKIEPPNVITNKESVKKIIFRNHQGPGDIVMLTAAVRDLHINYPGKYITDVRTSSMHIWEGNPYVEWGKGTPLDEKDPEIKSYDLGYPLIHQSNQGPYHFSEAFTEEIEDLLNIKIKRRIGKGDVHIRPEEDVWGWTERATWFKDYNFDPKTEYWIIDAGHKKDFTCKFWGKGKFQSVVNYFKGKIQFVQIGYKEPVLMMLEDIVKSIENIDDVKIKDYVSIKIKEASKFISKNDIAWMRLESVFKSIDKINIFQTKEYITVKIKEVIDLITVGTNHIHPKLDGVIDLVGKTDDRQLIRLIWASSGVLTPVSLPMVLAAAIPVKQGTCNGKKNRPCVAICGGREPSRWQADTNHQFIHTCGSLPCCDDGGCWKSRVKPIGDGDEKDVKNMCENVTIDDNGEEVPYCMHMISAEDVIRRIEMYFSFYQDNREKHTYNTPKKEK